MLALGKNWTFMGLSACAKYSQQNRLLIQRTTTAPIVSKLIPKPILLLTSIQISYKFSRSETLLVIGNLKPVDSI